MGELAPTMIFLTSGNQTPVRENQKMIRERVEQAFVDEALFIELTSYEKGECITVQWSHLELVTNAEKRPVQQMIDPASGVPLIARR